MKSNTGFEKFYLSGIQKTKMLILNIISYQKEKYNAAIEKSLAGHESEHAMM
jgi:hypothetical protein